MIDHSFLTYKPAIEAILTEAMQGKKYRAYLFGSRAAGTFTAASDIDIGVLADTPIDRELSLAREALTESTIPLTVDLVDLSRTDKAFKEQVLKQGILLWNN